MFRKWVKNLNFKESKILKLNKTKNIFFIFYKKIIIIRSLLLLLLFK